MNTRNTHSRLRILAEVSMVLYAILFITSIPALAVPGKRWPGFAVAAAFTLLPLAVGPRWLRWVGAIGLLLSAMMVISDLQQGEDYDERMRQKAHENEQPSMNVPANKAFRKLRGHI